MNSLSLSLKIFSRSKSRNERKTSYSKTSNRKRRVIQKPATDRDELFKIQQESENDLLKIQQERDELFKIQQEREKDLFKNQQQKEKERAREREREHTHLSLYFVLLYVQLLILTTVSIKEREREMVTGVCDLFRTNGVVLTQLVMFIVLLVGLRSVHGTRSNGRATSTALCGIACRGAPSTGRERAAAALCSCDPQGDIEEDEEEEDYYVSLLSPAADDLGAPARDDEEDILGLYVEDETVLESAIDALSIALYNDRVMDQDVRDEVTRELCETALGNVLEFSERVPGGAIFMEDALMLLDVEDVVSIDTITHAMCTAIYEPEEYVMLHGVDGMAHYVSASEMMSAREFYDIWNENGWEVLVSMMVPRPSGIDEYGNITIHVSVTDPVYDGEKKTVVFVADVLDAPEEFYEPNAYSSSGEEDGADIEQGGNDRRRRSLTQAESDERSTTVSRTGRSGDADVRVPVARLSGALESNVRSVARGSLSTTTPTTARGESTTTVSSTGRGVVARSGAIESNSDGTKPFDGNQETQTMFLPSRAREGGLPCPIPPNSVPYFGFQAHHWSTIRMSEELGGYSEYRRGAPIAGFRCTGSYCDNKYIRWYSDAPPVSQRVSEGWTDWFTDDRGALNVGDCATINPNAYVTQMQCRNRYCDDLRLRCESRGGVELVGTPLLAIAGREATCPEFHVISSIRCSGHFCRQLDLTCRRFRITLQMSDVQPQWSYVGLVDDWVFEDVVVQSASVKQTRKNQDTDTTTFESNINFNRPGATPASSSPWGFGITARRENAVMSSVEDFMSREISNTDTVRQRFERVIRCGSRDAILWSFSLRVSDDLNSRSSFGSNDFVCSLQQFGPPRCLPRNCGNVLSVTRNGVPGGCRCCKGIRAGMVLSDATIGVDAMDDPQLMCVPPVVPFGLRGRRDERLSVISIVQTLSIPFYIVVSSPRNGPPVVYKRLTPLPLQSTHPDRTFFELLTTDRFFNNNGHVPNRFGRDFLLYNSLAGAMMDHQRTRLPENDARSVFPLRSFFSSNVGYAMPVYSPPAVAEISSEPLWQFGRPGESCTSRCRRTGLVCSDDWQSRINEDVLGSVPGTRFRDMKILQFHLADSGSCQRTENTRSDFMNHPAAPFETRNGAWAGKGDCFHLARGARSTCDARGVVPDIFSGGASGRTQEVSRLCACVDPHSNFLNGN